MKMASALAEDPVLENSKVSTIFFKTVLGLRKKNKCHRENQFYVFDTH